MESTLTAFSAEFLDLVKENASENNQSIEQQLTEDVMEYIKEEGFACSPELLYFYNSKSEKPTAVDYFKINGFDYSDDSGILDLFITCYIESENIPEFTKSRIQQCQNHATRFLAKALSDVNFASLVKEENADAAEIIETIRSEYKLDHITLLRFFIISNGLRKVEVTFPSELTLDDHVFESEFQVWDIETVRRSDIASRCEGAIDIDFANYYNHAIECLELAESDGVKSYLAIMPAVILAKVFGEYKARLLNQNVRNYLGGKIKVNRGMAQTLRETPGLFFAYNNGISSTANGVSTIRDEETGKTVITNIRNWQIVNGGQTTNTIYSVYKQDPDKLTNVFVTMKLSEIKIADETKKGDAISNIARYANSQTQIKDSDLSANISYMVKLQEFSRSEWTPAASARPGTKWFFERMRGQYDTEAGDKKTKKYKIFVKENPKKTQRFLKTDLAKWEMAWHDEPYTASKGGEACYEAFYRNFLKDGVIEADQDYYHDLIAKAILYQRIADINRENGVKAYLNVICNYVLATISVKSKKQLDLGYIWAHQDIHSDLKEYIVKASEITKVFIDKINQDGENPTVKAKNATFWKTLLLRMANMPELSKSLIRTKSNTLTEAQKKILAQFQTIDISVWMNLATWSKNTRKLSLVERKRVDHIINFLQSKREIQFESAQNGMEILNKSMDQGFEKP